MQLRWRPTRLRQHKPRTKTTQCKMHPWNAHESMYDYRRSMQDHFWHAWTGTLA
jgi:hypothetical protein